MNIYKYKIIMMILGFNYSFAAREQLLYLFV